MKIWCISVQPFKFVSISCWLEMTKDWFAPQLAAKVSNNWVNKRCKYVDRE